MTAEEEVGGDADEDLASPGGKKGGGEEGKSPKKKKGKKKKGKSPKKKGKKKPKQQGGVLALRSGDWLKLGGGAALFALFVLLAMRAGVRDRVAQAARAASRPFRDLGRLVFG